MDVETSKEFVKVYEKISQLQSLLVDEIKGVYDSRYSSDDILDAPCSLSELVNDCLFATKQDVNECIECACDQFLKKTGEEEQDCLVPTNFDKLTCCTQDKEDSSENVATTAFVHDVVSQAGEHYSGVLAGALNTIDDKKFATTEYVDRSVSSAELQCQEFSIRIVAEKAQQIEHDVDLKISQLDIPRKTSQLENDSQFITLLDIPQDLVTSVNGLTGDVQIDIPQIPSNISYFNNDVGYITDPGVVSVNGRTGAVQVLENVQPDWQSLSGPSAILNKPALKRVATTADYNDLENLPEIPLVPTNISAFNNDVGYLTLHQDISGKYDKSGGTISGNVKIDGNFALNITDPDYDSGIQLSGSLDDNVGTILTLSGYAGDTSYRTIVRNVATPNSNYDAANKKYVDDNVVVPTYHLVELNDNWSVKAQASTLVYSTVASNLTNPMEADYLDIIREISPGSSTFIRFHVPCIGIDEVNSGDLIFNTNFFIGGSLLINITLTLDSNNVLSTVAVLQTPESLANKVQSVVNYHTSEINYPSTKAVFNEFQRKPVVIWEVQDVQNGLLAVKNGAGEDISDTMEWQLQDLDFSPYKRIKIYAKAGKKTSGVGVDASNTPGAVLEMSLDSRSASPTGGHYICSFVGQKPNDANRLYTITCAVSSDKTKFVVLRMSTLYGTAATQNSDVFGYIYKIEGYFD